MKLSLILNNNDLDTLKEMLDYASGENIDNQNFIHVYEKIIDQIHNQI